MIPGLKNIFLDEYEKAGKHDCTRIDTGFINPNKIISIPGQNGEENQFKNNPYGRMTPTEFMELSESLADHWEKNAPITIFVEVNGHVYINEGNHRLRAAIHAGINSLVEIRYFGNSQKTNPITLV